MTRRILAPLAALAVCAFALAAQAASDESSASVGMERMRDWAADHEALLDAKLAGLKAGLKLTADQEKLWPPFETAVRDAAKLRMEQMSSMIERMQKMREMMMQGMGHSGATNGMAAPGEAVSPVDRLEQAGRRLSERGAAITKVADAAKPLYASLDDSQKRRFALLGREMLMMGHGHGDMGMMRGGMGMMGEGMGVMGQRGTMDGRPMGPGDAGLMGGRPGRMDSMGDDADGDDDSPDEGE